MNPMSHHTGLSSPASPEVVLVSCYELGHEPLGSLVPAGVLARAGLSVRVMDVAVGDFDERSVATAPLVAISTPMHTAMRLGTRVAARVRELNPSAHICFHGLYAGLHAAHLVPALADTCLGAECESRLLALARAVRDAARAGRAPRDARVPGPLSIAPRARDRALNLSPLRDTAPGDRHVRLSLGGELRRVAYVSATRGCLHTCRHCPIPAEYGGAFYAIPARDVARDLERVVELGAQHITFSDADFLNGPTHALRVARDLHRRHPALTFDYTAKIEHLLRHPRVVDELQELGNVFVVSAVESFNDTVLERLHKGHTRADALAVIARFRARGHALRPSLVPFTPWETRGSLAELFAIVGAEGLVDAIDPVQYSIRLLIPEGSLLLADPELAPHLGSFDPVRLSHAWRHPDPGMDALQERLAGIAASAAPADPIATFGRMQREVAGRADADPLPHRAGRAPRLTEDWFC